jgi:hypothetical protein
LHVNEVKDSEQVPPRVDFFLELVGAGLGDELRELSGGAPRRIERRCLKETLVGVLQSVVVDSSGAPRRIERRCLMEIFVGVLQSLDADRGGAPRRVERRCLMETLVGVLQSLVVNRGGVARW